jgi:hypothetical protein
MQTETTNSQEEAKRIWENLDAEDRGETVTEAHADTPDEPEQTAAANATAKSQETVPGNAEADQAQDDDDPRLLKDKLLGMEAIVGQLQQRLRNAEGHIGGLSSQLKQKLETAQAVRDAGGEAPTAAQIKHAQENPEAFKALERDYPEFAAALAPAVDAKVNARMQELRQELEAMREQTSQRPQGPDPMQAMQKMRAEMMVEVRHPGWQETVRRPEFQGWLGSQSRELQMLAASSEPADAVRLLDLYQDTRKTTSTNRNQRLSSVAALPTGRSAVRAKPVDSMSPEEYWTYLDQLDRQKG